MSWNGKSNTGITLVCGVLILSIIACGNDNVIKPTSIDPIEKRPTEIYITETLSSVGKLEFMQGNDCTESVIGEASDERDRSINIKRTSNFTNDEARSVKLLNIQAGILLIVYDHPDGKRDDDWTEITLKGPVDKYCVNSFEETYEDDVVNVVYHEHNGLDGKVSRIEIQKISIEDLTSTQVPLATESSVPSSTPEPTGTSPTPVTQSSPNPTEELQTDLIVNANNILNLSIGDVEAILGDPIDMWSVGIAEYEEIPDGGSYREYQTEGYVVGVTFDTNGIAKGLQIFEGLIEDGYSLDQWPIVMMRIGINEIGLPNRTAPAALYWDDEYGYAFMIATDGIGEDIWTVRVYKIPD